MTSAFGGQRSIQLSYGRFAAPLSRIPLGGKRPRAQTWTPIGAMEIGRLDEGLPMRLSAQPSRLKRERLARFRLSTARRRGAIRVPGRLRSRRGR